MLDTEALRRRLGSARPPAGDDARRVLRRMLASGFDLLARPDHGFVLTMRGRGDREHVVRGTWRREGRLVMFEPAKRPTDGAPTVFRARPVPGGLVVMRDGIEVPLRRA